MLTFWFWLFVIPAALAALFSMRKGREFLEYVEDSLADPPDDPDGEDDLDEELIIPFHPAVTLIVPVRGHDHDLARNMGSLGALDYPDYELIVTARNSDDTGLLTARTILGERARFVAAGPPAAGTGEKVHNLLAAVKQARPASEVFAFADSDGQVDEDWLGNLVAPLEDETLGATTGFRWYFPEEGGFWPLLRSAWDSTIACHMSVKDKNFVWGGAMALRRATFVEADVERFWAGAVSDDYRLSAAINAAGQGIRFVPGAMVATTGSCTRKEFLAWARRQLTITRVYRPHPWTVGFVGHIVYCGAMVLSLAMVLVGNTPLGLGALVVTTVPGMAKGALRGTIARLMFPRREGWFDRYGGAYFWLVPIATWVWLVSFAGSAVTRKIEWRGYVYDLVSSDRTVVLKAPDR